MASKSMQALLSTTFHSCQKAGTAVHESGLTVSIVRQPGEIILFFQTDSSEGRKSLNMVGEGLKICDYLVFYIKDNRKNEIVCFLELKGKKLEQAVKQVVSTYEHILFLSKQNLTKKQLANILWKVCIYLHGQAPREGQQVKDQLIKVFGKENIQIKHVSSHFKLLGDFLRG